MLGRGKLVGGLLIAVGIGVFFIVTAFVVTGLATGQVQAAGAALGIGFLGCVPLLLLAGAGTFLVITGRKDEAEKEMLNKKQQILGMIQTHGQASLSEVMLEMELNREQVTQAIYELVSMGLFSGYTDWEALIFYSKDAAQVGSNSCPNCGGIRELVGKGVVKCPYCGVALFIPPDAEQTTATPTAPEDLPESS
jgi:hypothetical protein